MRALMRRLGAVVGAGLLVAGGCVEPADPPGSLRRASGPVDAAGDRAGEAARDAPRADAPSPDVGARDSQAEPGAGPCGAVPDVGCCQGETLYFCREGRLVRVECGAQPRCGWNPAGFYDCNTTGTADPSGLFAKSCSLLVGDASLPTQDGPRDAAPGCGAISIEGCCAGTSLRYCEQGRVREVSCAHEPRCGWDAAAGFYDCGTAGGSDPSGQFPKSCPGEVAADGALDYGYEAIPDGPVPEIGVDGGEPGDGGEGCGCSTGRRPSAAGLVWLALAALLAVARRRG